MNSLIEEVKSYSSKLKTIISLESVLISTFDEFPYPAWIKLPQQHMLVNKMFLSENNLPSSFINNFNITEHDKIVMKSKHPFRVEDKSSIIQSTQETINWTGWKIPLLIQDEVIAIAGYAEKWQKV